MDFTFKTEDGKLIFTFDPARWSLIHSYDLLPDVARFSDSKLDFIGLLDSEKLFLIEVKNLRDRPITAFKDIVKKLQIDQEAKYDTKNQPIVKEMLDCVKDSLLFMSLRERHSTTETDLWIELAALLRNKTVKIIVVLCLETDKDYLPKIDEQMLKVLKSHIVLRLKAVFSRLTDHVFVFDSKSNSPFFKIEYQN
jgi:hypothetical protein